MNFTIREAVDGDLEALLALFQPYYQELLALGMRYKLDEEALPDVLRAQIRSRMLIAVVAEAEDGTLAGFYLAALTRLPREYRSDSPFVGLLQEVYVIPEARRHSLATRMYDYIVEWYRAHGVKEIRGEVLLNNTLSMSIWEKKGFSRFATIIYKTLD